MIYNNTNSTVTQALRDIVAAAAERGNVDAARMIEGGFELLSDIDIENADHAFASHQYPDHTLQWGRFSVDGPAAIPFDFLDADSAYLASWIARHISGFSNYVCFKISTLTKLGVGGYKYPWSVAKIKRVLADLQSAGVLVVVDRSYTHDIGTVYMLDPSYIDFAGTESRRELQYKYYDTIAPDRRSDLETDRVTYADMQYQSCRECVQPITITLPGSKNRARVSWLNIPNK